MTPHPNAVKQLKQIGISVLGFSVSFVLINLIFKWPLVALLMIVGLK